MRSVFYRSEVWRCCAFVIVFVSVVFVASAEDRTAYVLDVRGRWRLEHASTDLPRAATVQEGSRLQHFAGSQQEVKNASGGSDVHRVAKSRAG